MFDIQAALGLVQLSRLEEMQAARLKIAAKYQEAFGKIDALDPPFVPDYATHCWHLYVLRIVPELLPLIATNSSWNSMNEMSAPVSTSFRFTTCRLIRSVLALLTVIFRWHKALRTIDFSSALSYHDGRAGNMLLTSVTDIVETYHK